MPEFVALAFWLCAAGGLLALLRLPVLARVLIGLGAAAGVVHALQLLPHCGAWWTLSISLADQPVRLHYTPEGLWLMGFGLVPAALAVWLCTPAREGRCGWLFGAAVSIIGALGVYGVQDGYSFLISWELMSLGGAVMILSERLSGNAGQRTLFMLALLEVGAVALLLAVLLLAQHAGGSMAFEAFPLHAGTLSPGARVWIGILFLVGFGAKLGLLPFYEWFPGAYATGSGASGAIMSGVVLNAAYFALSRALVDWLPTSGDGHFYLGLVVTAIGVLSSILAVLYAFQQDDWRRLLAFSSAENAAIAVTTLGACLLFRSDRLLPLAGLAWTVSLLHLGGHALAKGGLFLCADGVYLASGEYVIRQGGWLRRAGIAFGIGALFAGMSLAAMPPQIGFVTEWFTFQTLFQGFHLATLTGRLTLALAGAGTALTAAIALATFIKLLGIGLLGAPAQRTSSGIGRGHGLAVLLLGLLVLAAAVGLPAWLAGLDPADFARFGSHSADAMTTRWLLVPLTDTFSFISPSKLVIVMPLLAILPLLLLLNLRRHALRYTRVWYGGMRENPQLAATTTLTFANAMRTFYSFIYRPTLDTARQTDQVAYFIRRVELDHDVADVFRPLIFAPAHRAILRLARWMRALQSGDLNVYLALIGALLILILALTLR
ncbi:MAG TPA: proton-conducting transporter membrane subunit [Steroidobacteraceae bacterium]|nr:proton-conducting transporter membrane subunit [Steroidobacteraceae bacterium]